MEAHVGDWLVVHGRTLDRPVRRGRVLEVAHPDGSPPWVVRWSDGDRTSVVVPGPDTTVEPPDDDAAGG